jgi:hypothetical protein
MIVLRCVDVIKKRLSPVEIAEFLELDETGSDRIQQCKRSPLAGFNQLLAPLQTRIDSIKSAERLQKPVFLKRRYSFESGREPRQTPEEVWSHKGQITGYYDTPVRFAGRKSGMNSAQRSPALENVHSTFQAKIIGTGADDFNRRGNRCEDARDSFNQGKAIEREPRFVRTHPA